MAVAKLSKLFIVTHNSETGTLLKKIQRYAQVEIRPYSGKIGEEIPAVDVSADNNLKVKKALDIINDFKDREMKKLASRAGRIIVSRDRYDKIPEKRELEDIAENIIDMGKEVQNIDARMADAIPKINHLKIWSCYRYNLEDIGSGDVFTIRLGLIKSSRPDFEQIAHDLDDNKISFEVLSEEGDITYAILAYHNDYRKEAEEFLGSIAFEAAEITGYKGTISQNLDSIEKNMRFYRERKENLVKSIREAGGLYEEELTIYLDYLDNSLEVEQAVRSGFSTESVSFYTAWIKEKDKENIFLLIGRFSASRVVEIAP
ncbi:MAG: hypothetical protein JW770_01460, partial [Actinobacteria bacterium]|nr:hypothetical protein [Actinomycetota bacterium]